VAELESVGDSVVEGHRGRVHFTYDDDYALQHLGARDHRAASCCLPVDFDVHTGSPWPAFMLDILPAGAARRTWVAALRLKNDESADWQLILRGASHPPGNLRVLPSEPPPSSAQGFTRAQVGSRDPQFVEYAYEHRAGVAGTSGAHGESPKFLLTEALDGLLHADGALADAQAKRHWLVKWPRSNRDSDRQILRNESAYLHFANRMGLRVHAEPVFEDDTLYVKRFDRHVTSDGVERYGLESLCSLAGVAAYGARIPQERLVQALADFSTNPDADIIELVKRDILSVALGNTDNHARNQALLKTTDGAMRLSPLFDFAPMFLDESGIPRCCRWTAVESMGFPSWPGVVDMVEPLMADPVPLRPALRIMADGLSDAPELLLECGADSMLVERLRRRIEDVRCSLHDIEPVRKSRP